ncbi:hypothetical protein Ae331Ps2_6132c [Pseudonocardia sp. Ae331_Ps2]|nr:hypothetical protein Ae331Ps2_6132c [Pseudonocardia sp. Ae331_Ps2]
MLHYRSCTQRRTHNESSPVPWWRSGSDEEPLTARRPRDEPPENHHRPYSVANDSRSEPPTLNGAIILD